MRVWETGGEGTQAVKVTTSALHADEELDAKKVYRTTYMFSG